MSPPKDVSPPTDMSHLPPQQCTALVAAKYLGLWNQISSWFFNWPDRNKGACKERRKLLHSFHRRLNSQPLRKKKNSNKEEAAKRFKLTREGNGMKKPGEHYHKSSLTTPREFLPIVTVTKHICAGKMCNRDKIVVKHFLDFRHKVSRSQRGCKNSAVKGIIQPAALTRKGRGDSQVYMNGFNLIWHLQRSQVKLFFLAWLLA